VKIQRLLLSTKKTISQYFSWNTFVLFVKVQARFFLAILLVFNFQFSEINLKTRSWKLCGEQR